MLGKETTSLIKVIRVIDIHSEIFSCNDTKNIGPHSLEEYEERSMIEPAMHDKWEFQELVKILVNWINDELRYPPVNHA